MIVATAPIIPTMIPQHTTSYYHHTTSIPQQHQQQPLFKTDIMELSELCSIIVQALYGGEAWDMDRQMNFTLFCNRLLLQLDIPPCVVYMSLKYFQNILLKDNQITTTTVTITTTTTTTTHEYYSLFTVSLLLAYKFLEDNPPFMNQWSFASMISIQELKALELQALDKLEFSLNVPVHEFYQWTEQCNNAFYGAVIVAGCCYDNNDFAAYHDGMIVPQPTMSSTSSSSASSIPDDDYCWLPATASNYYHPTTCAVISNSVDDFLFIDHGHHDYNSNDYYYPPPSLQDYTTSCTNNNNTSWLLQQQQQQQQQPIPIDQLWYLTQPNAIFL